MSALVSCIIPVHDGERYVRESIDSVLAQTHPSMEVIVVDDGSTDGTADLVRAIPEVRYALQANAGPFAARNTGLSLARGTLIAFLDADDLWLPEKIARQVAHLESRPDVSASLTRVRHFWEAEVSAEEAHYQRTGRVEAGGFAASTMLVRRELFAAAGVFDHTLPHTGMIEWFGRLRDLGVTTDELPETLVLRRMHGSNHGRREHAMREEFLLLARRSMKARRGPTPA